MSLTSRQHTLSLPLRQDAEVNPQQAVTATAPMAQGEEGRGITYDA